MVPPFFERQPFIQSFRKYLYRVYSMTSNRDKIMKKTSRAPAYFLVKSIRCKTLRKKKKRQGKNSALKWDNVTREKLAGYLRQGGLMTAFFRG